MKPRRIILPAVLLAMAVVPALAQDPPAAPQHQEAAPTPQVVERASRPPSDDRSAVRAPRPAGVARTDSGPRERAAAPATGAAAPPALEQQGGRRRPSGGGRVSGGGSGSGARPRAGGVRSPGSGSRAGQGAQAVPRGRAVRPPQGGGGNTFGRRYYVGPSGLGYYFYDPWSWYGWGPGIGGFGAWGAWNGFYGNNWAGYGNAWGGGWGGPWGGGWNGGWGTGGVRLKVNARDAEVYVDGYYAGIVDDFDGIWQQLRLDDGGYRVEIRKPGFETLTFDVMVQPGRTITYRGRMEPAP